MLTVDLYNNVADGEKDWLLEEKGGKELLEKLGKKVKEASEDDNRF